MTGRSHRRSVVKATSYRVFAVSMVFAIAFAYAGSFSPAAKIGVTAAVGKTALYYVWERVWNRVSWGVEGS